MKKAVGYCRVSTEEQAKEGISLEHQEAKIKQYAGLHNLKLVDIIIDKGKSGKDLNREGINEILSLIKKKLVTDIIVYKMDRLTRRTFDLLFLVEEVFKKNNVQFHSISERIDTSSAMGQFFLTIIGAMAQMERDLISERTKAVLQYKIGKGEYVGSPALGYLASTGDNKFLGIDEREQDTVKRILYLKRYRKMSLGKIAKELNENDVKTKRGGKWHSGTIKLILDRGESKFKTNSKLDTNKEMALV
jgi:DNA invertase Pin-like site-specific DNA recombinase